MLRMPVKTWSLVAVALLASLSTLSWGRASEKATEFNIPPQPLDSALLEFAKQADVQLSVSTVAIVGMTTQGIVGQFTPAAALARLLSETGLQFTAIGDRTYSVSLARSGSAGNSAGARSGTHSTLALRADDADQVVVAQSAAQAAVSQGADVNESRGVPPALIDELVVTGSHIRAAQPVGYDPIVLNQDFIDRSGYATVQDVLKLLPQNFGGGISEDSTTDPSALNLSSGTAINLRGLGADSTLVLVNGIRQPSGGLNGAFVDVSNIAASAVERIEVLPDGASAIYGSDAIGGVVNIILKRDYAGAETRIRAGSFDGDADENQLSQLLGMNWEGGNAMFAYQFYDRDPLHKLDREYTASDDLTAFGGTDHRGFNSNPGNVMNGLLQPVFAIPAGQDGTSLTSADLLPGVVNFNETSLGADLLPEQRMHSAYLTASQGFGSQFEFTANAKYSLRDSLAKVGGVTRTVRVRNVNPHFVAPTPTATAVTIGYNFYDDLGPLTVMAESETFGGDLALHSRIGSDWALKVAGSYAEERNNVYSLNNVNNTALTAALADTNPATAFNPFGDGSNTNPDTLNRIRGTQFNRANSRIETAFAIADGPVFAMWGGDAKVAIGTDYRDESLSIDTVVNGTPTFLGELSRQVSSGFAELVLPLVGTANRRTGIHGMKLSLAGRYENYSDFGGSFNPRVGFDWAVSDAIGLRGSWGTSFRAPRLVELLEGRPRNSESLELVPDPQDPTEASTVLFRLGNNAELKEETADTWSFGTSLTLGRSGPDLSFSYYNIDYSDRIAAGGPAGDPFSILLVESEWQDIVNRTPERSEIDALCNSPHFVGDVATCLETVPSAIIDGRLRNLSAVQVSGIDALLEQTIPIGGGALKLGLMANYVLEFERAVSSSSDAVELADTVGNVPDFRVRGSVGWSFGGLGIDAVVNHTGSYEDNIRIPSRRIDSWTTVDFGVGYTSDSRGDWLDGIDVGLSAVNVFDEKPPFVDVAFVGYDASNADLYGRLLSVRFAKSW